MKIKSFGSRIKELLTSHWEPTRGKGAFIRSIPRNGRVLDVGCGNNSPMWFKSVRPDIYYVGLDIGDYNQTNSPSEFANEYIVTTPESFADEIEFLNGQMDAVVSCHNLEHCNEPSRVLIAMVNALKDGGTLYLSFPCEESVGFPHRAGCLNFFDDSTHKEVPCWNCTLKSLQRAGCILVFTAKRYRPFPLILRGLFLEPLSIFRRSVIPDGSTWALYGFESLIWGSTSLHTEVRLDDWGPRATKKGHGVNIQPDGTSALWISGHNLNHFGEVWIEFSNQRPKAPAMVTDTLITSEIPDETIRSKGIYKVAIVENSGGKTDVGKFIVN
ncbi:MAG: class I SAM-dependent methyltransferase [Ferrovum sp.]|nr:class I SAM-dependent methyltransferase [Ferrovum sp.]